MLLNAHQSQDGFVIANFRPDYQIRVFRGKLAPNLSFSTKRQTLLSHFCTATAAVASQHWL